jgi:hypothetical protein
LFRYFSCSGGDVVVATVDGRGNIVRSQSVANPWRDPKIAVLTGWRVVKDRIRPLLV